MIFSKRYSDLIDLIEDACAPVKETPRIKSVQLTLSPQQCCTLIATLQQAILTVDADQPTDAYRKIMEQLKSAPSVREITEGF